MPESTAPASGTLRFVIRALRHRNYRLFFSGQLVSLVGTWLTIVATSWLVYRLARESYPHQDALLLGLVGFAGQIPFLLLSPIAGVWVDRHDQLRILLWTQTLSMLQSLALAGLTLAGLITIPQIIVLNALQGVVNALDLPTRQALVIELIEDPGDLSNAIALNSSMVHMARLVGPSVAGFLIYAVGEGTCFLIDGLSYCAVLGALWQMRLRPRAGLQHPSAWHALREGIKYAAGFAPIRTLLLFTALVSMMAMSQSTLMPIYANQILGGHARTFGLLLSASGSGALTGALYLASRHSVLGLGRIIVAASFALGGAIIGLAFAYRLAVSLLCLVASGCALVVVMASINTVLQTIVDDDKRGRVMSLYGMAFMGMAPFGSLLAGSVASRIGVPGTLAAAGGVIVLAAATLAWQMPSLRAQGRAVYRQKGFLPDTPESQ